MLYTGAADGLELEDDANAQLVDQMAAKLGLQKVSTTHLHQHNYYSGCSPLDLLPGFVMLPLLTRCQPCQHCQVGWIFTDLESIDGAQGTVKYKRYVRYSRA